MTNYAKIKNFDTANGEGLGVSVFFSGCDKEPKCKGCFNREAWDYNAGEPFTRDIMQQILDMISSPHIDHLSILGGEPLAANNVRAVAYLCHEVKSYYSDKKIWLWTHYQWKDLVQDEFISKTILPYVNVVVDGPYTEEQRDLTLKWRGSKNQRVIDSRKSLEVGSVVLHCK